VDQVEATDMKIFAFMLTAMLLFGMAGASYVFNDNVSYKSGISGTTGAFTGKVTCAAGTTTGDAARIDQVWLRVNKSGDTMSGPIAMGSQKITGLGTGTSSGDACTMATHWLSVNKSGDTMSGALAMGSQKITGLAAPTTTGDAARINDVWSRVNKSGDTMSGALAMGAQKITGLAAPTASGDAARIEDVWGCINKSGGTIATGGTLAVTDADKITSGGVVVPENITITIPINNRTANGTAFTAINDNYKIVAASEVHSVACTYGGATALALVKVTGTQAPASAGVVVQTAGFDLKGTVETVQLATMAGVNNCKINATDRLGIRLNNPPTALDGGSLTIVLQRV
jgi:hypothetical protein